MAKGKKRRASFDKASNSNSQQANLIPKDVLSDSAARLKTAMKFDKKLLTRSTRELLAKNETSAIKDRLETAGMSRSAAQDIADATAGSRAITGDTSIQITASETITYERILGVNDLVDVRFLLKGAKCTQSVCRIAVGRSFATGFLVAPGVLMTNWHVFQQAADAKSARAEFDFRELVEGGERTIPTIYRLNPSLLFVSNRELDVAIVALGERVSGKLDASLLPFCPLNCDNDGVLIGDRLNVIQHPAGEPKQVAVRDNKVIAKSDDTFLQYKADTKRGSSGSPVFTDEWELVGLHHSGVPNTDDDGNWLAIGGGIWSREMGDDRIDWIANEAIQGSALYEFIAEQDWKGAAVNLVEGILNPPEQIQPSHFENTAVTESTNSPQKEKQPSSGNAAKVTIDSVAGNREAVFEDGNARITLPIEITVHLGEGLNGNDGPSAFGLAEKFGIDEDYTTRNGYDEAFLKVKLPMPGLTKKQGSVAAVNQVPIAGDAPYVLRYHNFSLVMNGERRIPFFTAVNIDGANEKRIRRDTNGGIHDWITDDRIGKDEQTNNNHYKGRSNRLDRGHLVRRLDPGWGDAWADSARGIVDTFHYTNCAPQYDRFNRNYGPDGLWLGLENYVLNNAHEADMQVSVFSGPVFRDDDPDYRDNGVLIPRQYWKIVAWVDEVGALQTAAFLLSQEGLLDQDVNIEMLSAESFDFRTRKLFQSTVAEIANLTELKLPALIASEKKFSAQESFTEQLEVQSFEDIRL